MTSNKEGQEKLGKYYRKKPNVSPELQYKFALDLIMLDPYETVEPWMVTSNLNPRILIPALMHYFSEPHTKKNDGGHANGGGTGRKEDAS
ncbi:hypothetical protein SUGI_0764140 [Cryptomeria japonica]|nr:hypothetical protein SUGI_0764140 [Cryptomeria japonica]